MDEQTKQSRLLQTIVDAMDKSIGCGVGIGRDTCQRGYECQSCGHMRLAVMQLRAIFPSLGPSKIKEPKVCILGPDDILTAERAVSVAASIFKKHLKK